MSLPQSKNTKKESKRPLAQRAQAAFKNASISLLSLSLPILTFPYYSAFMRNTLNAIDAIRDEPDPSVKNDLIHRFIQFKINESKYVQVAGAIIFTSANSVLSWENIATSHWSASALFYSCIVLSLVAIVTGAQQQMVFPTDDPNLKKMDLSKIADVILRTEQHDDDTTTHNRANYALIFALQTPLMLLSLTVAAFLAGLFSVVFNRLGSNLLWGDDTKIAVLFGTVNLLAVVIFVYSSRWIYQIPNLEPQRIRDSQSVN